MMPDETPSALGDDGVQGVDRLRVGVIHPRAEHAQPAQLAPIFVAHDVIRIVGPGAFVQEPVNRATGQRRARYDAVGPVGIAMGPAQLLVDVSAGHGAPAACACAHLCVGRNRQIRRLQRRDVRLRHVIPERVEQSRHDDFGRRPKLGITWRVELEEIARAGRVRDCESRGHAIGFSADRPLSVGGSAVVVRTAHHFRGRQRPRPDAILEPGRVRHLINRVDAGGPADIRSAGPTEQIGDRVVGERNLAPGDLRSVLGVDNPRNRVVAVKLRRTPGLGLCRNARSRGDSHGNKEQWCRTAHDAPQPRRWDRGIHRCLNSNGLHFGPLTARAR
jgi:hypothetical protein